MARFEFKYRFFSFFFFSFFFFFFFFFLFLISFFFSEMEPPIEEEPFMRVLFLTTPRGWTCGFNISIRFLFFYFLFLFFYYFFITLYYFLFFIFYIYLIPFLKQEESHTRNSPNNEKEERTSTTRRLYERVVSLKQSSKKTKHVFKRYLEFEREMGDGEEGAKRVREKVRAYLMGNE